MLGLFEQLISITKSRNASSSVAAPSAAAAQHESVSNRHFTLVQAHFRTLKKIVSNRRLPFSMARDESILFNLEYYVSVKELDLILETSEKIPDLAMCQRIQQFLSNRWKRIHNSFLAYPTSRMSDLTELCIELAKLIFPQLREQLPGEENEKCYYQLLMPTLQQLSDPILGTLLKDLPLHNFIVSEDGASFIIVHDTLEYWMNSSDQTLPYRLNQQNAQILLTPSEQQSLKFHSAQTYACYPHIEQYHVRRSAPTAAQAMRTLVAGLRACSVRRGVGTGGEYQADTRVFRYINVFRDFLSHCSPQDQERILSARALQDPFRNYWNTLSIGNNSAASTGDRYDSETLANALAQGLSTETCINIISDKVEAIIGANPFLEEIMPVTQVSRSLMEHLPDILQQKAELERELANCGASMRRIEEPNPFVNSVERVIAFNASLPYLSMQLQSQHTPANRRLYFERGEGLPFYNQLLPQLPRELLLKIIATVPVDLSLSALFEETALFAAVFSGSRFSDWIGCLGSAPQRPSLNEIYYHSVLIFPKTTLAYLVKQSSIDVIKTIFSMLPVSDRLRLFLRSVIDFSAFYQDQLIHFLHILYNHILPFQDQVFTTPLEQEQFQTAIYSFTIGRLPMASVIETLKSYPLVLDQANPACEKSLFVYLLRKGHTLDDLINELVRDNVVVDVLSHFVDALSVYFTENPEYPNKGYYLLSLLERASFPQALSYHIFSEHTQAIVSELSARDATGQHVLLPDMTEKQKKQMCYLYLAPQPLDALLKCRESDQDVILTQDSSMSFLIATFYALMLRNHQTADVPLFSFSFGTQNKKTGIAMSERGSGASLFVSNTLLNLLFTALPNEINALPESSQQQQKYLIKHLLALYIKHRELALQRKGNNFFTLLHVKGYSGEKKIAAANVLSAAIDDSTTEIPNILLPVLKQGALGAIYHAYQNMMSSPWEDVSPNEIAMEPAAAPAI